MAQDITTTEVLIIGAGQAGVAMSEHLTRLEIPHLVLEKARVAEAWRSGRWDSLVANGPAWHDRFPGMTFPGAAPGDFVTKDQVADYLNEYARSFQAPIRTGVEVLHAARHPHQPGFRVQTSAGEFNARFLVSATGPFQRPVIPAIAPQVEGLTQIHSAAYKNPQQFAPGGVLVVGAGSSGVQIADELNRAGREVWLSVGAHDRPPRSYRGRDFCWWLGVLGLWDAPTTEPGKEHVTIAVSGARGGQTIDFRRLAAEGIRLVGQTTGFDGAHAEFAANLADNIRRGDENYLGLLDAADAWIARNGADFPEEPEARELLADPACMTQPVTELDLTRAGIRTIIWATGYARDYGWLDVDTFDERGNPRHQRGVGAEPEVYFLGLPWLSRRGSSFIWGVWHDARFIADQIAIRRQYLDWTPGR